MKSLYPLGVYRYLRSISQHRYDFAYLKLNHDRLVIESDGDLQRFGLSELDPTLSIDEQFAPLIGVLPTNNYAVVLLNVNMADNRFIDIHIINDGGNQWVALIDKTTRGREQQSEQQQQLDYDLLEEQRRSA